MISLQFIHNSYKKEMTECIFICKYIFCLESKLAEEPLVLTSLITFFEKLLDDLLGIFTLSGLLESISRDSTLDLF
jgi:hypothetical protein